MNHIIKFNESSNNISVIKVYGKKFTNTKVVDRYWELVRSKTDVFISKSEISKIKSALEVIYKPRIDISFDQNELKNKYVSFNPVTPIEHFSVRKFSDDWYVADVVRLGSSSVEIYLCDQMHGVELLLKLLSGEMKYDPKQTEW